MPNINVSDIMQLDILKNSAVRSGEAGLTNAVSGITIMEGPDIAKWLNGGEVLLTQLSQFTACSLPLSIYFETLALKGISALIIKTGTPLSELPKDLLKTGEQHHIPIIEIPLQTRYIDIITPVMQFLLESKNQHYLDIQNDLTTLISSGAQEKEIADFLAIHVPARIQICDDDENIIYDTNSDDPIPSFGYKDRIRLPIMCFREVAGYLKAASADLFTIEHETILKNAANLMAVTFMKKYYVAEVEQKYASLFMEALFSGSLDERQIAEKLSSYGWNTADSYLAASVTLEKQMTSPNTNVNLIPEIINELSKMLPDFNCLSYIGGNVLHILCHGNTAKIFHEIAEQLMQSMDYMKTYLEDLKAPVIFYAGASTEAKGSAALPGKIKEASDALSFSKVFQSGIVHYSELGALRMLASYSRREDLVDMIPQPVKKLADYDQQNNTTYLNTLDSLLGNNLNLSKTAKELFIHYKTMLRRMERICEIAEISLEDRQQRLDIELGVKLFMLLPK